MSVDMDTSSVYFSTNYTSNIGNHHHHQQAAATTAPPATTTMSAQLAIRNKYNTLTPAEAKKLNTRFSLNYNNSNNLDSLSTTSSLSRRPPIRTASVMHKPRPPPLVVTDLDSDEMDSDFGLSAGSSNGTAGNASINNDNKLKSSSKTSLSSATYKVFHGPYANFKRFMRNMPRLPFSSSSPVACQPANTTPGKITLDNFCTQTSTSTISSINQHLQQQHHTRQSHRDSRQPLEESISQLCLNRSQSPPVCPPPPGELKSMSYMEDSITYSNYDEFTRSRNEQLNTWHGPRSTTSSSRRLNCFSLTPSKPNFDVYSIASSTQAHNNNILLDSSASDSSWQLASLPVTYERNLTTVCEETKQHKAAAAAVRDITGPHRLSDENNYATANGYDVVDNQVDFGDTATPRKTTTTDQRGSKLIKPPSEFDDSLGKRNSCLSEHKTRPNISNLPAVKHASLANSSQSLASTTTADSVLDYHRQTATKFRFSFAQATPPPSTPVNKDAGLPPRMPPVAQLTGCNNNNNNRQAGGQVDTSSGNSSNNSSQLNGINDCDKQHQQQPQHQQFNDNEAKFSSTRNNQHFVDSTNESDRISFISDDNRSTGTGYGNLNGTIELSNDNDTTLLSDTSTILGGDPTSNATLAYANKCAELERKVAFLENKLANKDKKLTDLQLSQFRKDDTIDRLRSQVNKLEKENGRLKMAMMVSSNSSSSSAVAVSHSQARDAKLKLNI